MKGTPINKGRDEGAESALPYEASLIVEPEDEHEAPEPGWSTDDPAFFIKDSGSE